MQHHWWVLALVCAFSSLVAFKPSEPFIVVFLRCVKQLSRQEIFKEVYPVSSEALRLHHTRRRLTRQATHSVQVWTYAYLGLLPALSALAEFVGYRWVVLIGVLGRLATLALLLAPSTNGSLPLMELQEVFIAAGFAAHPALMAIAYRTLPAEAYSRAAGFTACAGVVAQVRIASPTHRRPPPPDPLPVSTARPARTAG